uniref:Retrovirus-related Pol polyprotein from transposon TNT 1-94 n=1 Tax=Rhizophora mucronata TaxID=61149 RepID=A0A2P2KKG1_RHIMU
MMFARKVPSSFWGKAILTASYLINQLPFKSSQVRTTLSVMLEMFLQIHLLHLFSPKPLVALLLFTIMILLEVNLTLKLLNACLLVPLPLKKGTNVIVHLLKGSLCHVTYISLNINPSFSMSPFMGSN